LKIVVMDDVTLDEEQRLILDSMGEVTVYSGIPETPEEILIRAKNAEIIISGWTYYPEGLLAKLPDLRLISLWATGTDYVNIEEAQAAGITVSNVPGYAANAVAELVFGLVLSVARKISSAHHDVKTTGAYHWQKYQGQELNGKTIGILGTGAIGEKVARIARGFDMKVLAYDIRRRTDLEAEGLLKYVKFEEIFLESNVVTIHMPMIEDTRGIITYKELEKMPLNSVLINTARAGLIDQEALTVCLEKGLLAGAGLDDIDLEHASAKRLMALEQVVLTPHIGFFTEDAIRVKSLKCVENVRRYIDNRVSKEAYK
jgi:phosphoglycerate dehydrogenase-like enzyme